MPSYHLRTHRIAVAVLATCIVQPALTADAKPSDVSAWRTSTRAARPLSALLVGNSHILMPGFLKRVRKRIRAKTGRTPKLRTLAKIGTTLSKTQRQSDTARVLASAKWDVIVLQESTTAFLTGHGRRSYMSAVKWFNARKPEGAKLLLWETWPQGARHALYHRRGVWGRWFKNPPRSPKQLFSWIAKGTNGAAAANASYVSPIGSCWMRLKPGKRPYAKDRYHANTRGLTFIAEILARSMVATARMQAAPGQAAGACP